MITAKELRQKYLQFFKEKGHAVIPSASLIPEHDPTVLFTTAGMHPLIPYLLGEKHPLGKRLVDIQKCLRTTDIEEVGDNRHLTFFEMLGNWSLGDYFKKEAIEWSFEFLTSKRWLGIEPRKIYISVFTGDKDAPRDEEAIKIWQEQFKKRGIKAEVGDLEKEVVGEARIFMYGKKENWWGPPGEKGPCGPSTEMFYDTGRNHDPKFGTTCHPNCDCGRFIEIWNDVFMEYNKVGEGRFELLKQKNVDTGMGLERTVAVLNGYDNVFAMELFTPLIEKIIDLSGAREARKEFLVSNERPIRIIADHLRAATFILGDEQGIIPSNLGQGYILRRLIRRAVRYGQTIGLEGVFSFKIAEVIIDLMKETYPELEKNKDFILNQLIKEEEKFKNILEKGIKEFEKNKEEIKKLIQVRLEKTGKEWKGITKLGHGVEGKSYEYEAVAKIVFDLYQSKGLPPEITVEKIQEIVPRVDRELLLKEYEKLFQKHQELSRTTSAGMFKGGLVEASEQTTKYHTATHLLLAALREILGPEIYQKGSNITAERLRFDFNYPQKLSKEQIKKIEDLVNWKIQEKIPVEMEEMPKKEALKVAKVSFDPSKYGEKVKVYKIGDFSIELCGGPHVKNTGELGHFKIIKEEASSAGVRRIKAILE